MTWCPVGTSKALRERFGSSMELRASGSEGIGKPIVQSVHKIVREVGTSWVEVENGWEIARDSRWFQEEGKYGQEKA
jgi:hypothetical protein